MFSKRITIRHCLYSSHSRAAVKNISNDRIDRNRMRPAMNMNMSIPEQFSPLEGKKINVLTLLKFLFSHKKDKRHNGQKQTSSSFHFWRNK